MSYCKKDLPWTSSRYCFPHYCVEAELGQSLIPHHPHPMLNAPVARLLSLHFASSGVYRYLYHQMFTCFDFSLVPPFLFIGQCFSMNFGLPYRSRCLPRSCSDLAGRPIVSVALLFYPSLGISPSCNSYF